MNYFLALLRQIRTGHRLPDVTIGPVCFIWS